MTIIVAVILTKVRIDYKLKMQIANGKTQRKIQILKKIIAVEQCNI